MNYYEVWPADSRYHGQEALTYASKKTLKIAQIVSISVNNKTSFGVVARKAEKPDFKVKTLTLLEQELVLTSSSIKLLGWLRAYYPAGLGALVSNFLPKGLLLKNKRSQSSTAKNTTTLKLPRLTGAQSKVVEKIRHSKGSFLLHGDTGSGKTRIYQELAKDALKNGQSVLILAPEIALTAQLISSFENFPHTEVVVLHSNLTSAQKRQNWLKIIESRLPLVIIGPRSALFSPVSKLGLIVVDEAHEAAYKQEQTPYYNGLRVASKLAEIHGCKLIFGSATPSISEYYLAEKKGIPIIRLASLAINTPIKNRVKIVNAREKNYFTRNKNLSDELLNAVEAAIKNGEQSLIFLNRRGTARVILCQNCGWQSLCPNCDLPLTYHGDEHSMRCHTCGHKEATPTACPVCQSADIVFKSIGTKTIASSLKQFFPKAKVARFDADNVGEERFEKNYQSVARGDFDIIVGTQILAKGLDLPKLAVVGVVAAESSLYFPDYTAAERTYQLLAQVIGRVGRGHRDGLAIIQTYEPGSQIIKAAVKQDFKSFYHQQLEERRLYGFPPFYHLLKLTARRKTKAGAQKTAQALKDKLEGLKLPVKIIGPSPAFHEKVGGLWQWQLVVKAKSRGELIKIIKELPAGWTPNIDPINLL